MRHVFFNCTKVTPLINLFEELCHTNSIDITCNEENFILNTFSVNDCHIINFMAIILKQWIYRQRCLKKPLSVHRFITEFESHHDVEFCIEKIRCNVTKHIKRLSPIFIFNCCNQP